MVRLNDSQEAFLARMTQAKKEYDEEAERIDWEAKYKKAQLKEPLRKLVAEAIDAGIPVRQIHQRGLGFAQVNSMHQFFEDSKETYAEKLARIIKPGNYPGLETIDDTTRVIAHPVSKSLLTGTQSADKVKVISKSEGRIVLEDSVGDEWQFNLGGVRSGNPILTSGFDAFNISHDARGLAQAIGENYPDVRISWNAKANMPHNPGIHTDQVPSFELLADVIDKL